MASRLARLHKNLLRAVHLAEDASLVALLSTMIVVAVLMIIRRNLSLTGFSWGDELLRVMVLWLGLFGAMAAARDRKHINIDLLTRFLPGKMKLASHAATALFTAAVCGFAAWYGYQFLLIEMEFGSTLIGELPSWTVQLIIPVAFALIGIRYLAHFFDVLAQLIGMREAK